MLKKKRKKIILFYKKDGKKPDFRLIILQPLISHVRQIKKDQCNSRQTARLRRLLQHTYNYILRQEGGCAVVGGAVGVSGEEGGSIFLASVVHLRIFSLPIYLVCDGGEGVL